MSARDVAAAVLLIAGAAQQPRPDAFTQTFEAATDGEAVATVRAGCAPCAWADEGREAAVLRVALDGKYSQHLALARGDGPNEYRVTLGAVTKGAHTLTLERDRALSAINAGAPAIAGATVEVLAGGGDGVAQSMAPILYARPNTVGKFTDLPILMWYEVAPTSRGRQYRYSVIFTNEDGGTATDRLMATWGRTTDIEFVYGVEIDGDGRVLAEEFQGPGHEVPPFRGRHEGRHPLLWVSTDNNMVSESGPTEIRYAPAPERFDLTNASREAVMDRHPWSYALASGEMRREGKIKDEGPGHNTIPDPRRFAFLEACGEVGRSALAFEVEVRGSWIASDRGRPQYRIVRDGCFRAAIPLPAGAQARDITAVRARAYTRAPSDGQPPAPPNPVHLTRINTLFLLDDGYRPGRPLLRWAGSATLAPDGAPFDLAVR